MNELVRFCKDHSQQGIAFITGAPGSGKTLAGLQVVHHTGTAETEDYSGVFLSGNRPLVEVIRKALSQDAARTGVGSDARKEMARRIETFIQHAYVFRNEYVANPEALPPEHVILFDEAQRAWDAERVKAKTRGETTRSEPELFLEFMSRFTDWSVIIAVVGSGQEINKGEAGLSEWGRALEQSTSNWVIKASPLVLPDAVNIPGEPLFERIPDSVQLEQDPRLHLTMNVRSPRAEKLNQWVDALIDLRIEDAVDICASIVDFPLVLTRNLDSARRWLRDRTDQDHRCGLLANADARRLRAFGLDTKALINNSGWAHWFLRPNGDIRSSNQLEVPASNFDCQGLELDYVGMCWGNDMTYDPVHDDWRTRKFRGSSWQNARSPNRDYMLYSYRVLLTRARMGMVIWVPESTGYDPTINPAYLDHTADLIARSGVPLLAD